MQNPTTPDLNQALKKMPRMEQAKVSESMTSAGRLDKMLGSNSPLMKRAQTQGLQQAQSRGLLNSSMAAGAAQGAMIDRAQPFALQDSQSLIQNQQFNVGQRNQQGLLQSQLIGDSYLSNQNYAQQMGLNEQAYGFERGLNEQQFGFQTQRDETLAGFDQDMARLQADLREAQASGDFGREQELLQMRAGLEQERDELLFGQQLTRDERLAGFDRDMARLGQELQEAQAANDFGRAQTLERQRADLQAERDRTLFGYDMQNTERQAEIQAERDRRLSELDADAARLGQELQEAQAQNDFGRAQELTREQAAIQETRDQLLFAQNMERDAQQFDNQQQMTLQNFQNEMARMGYAFDLDQMNVSNSFASGTAAQTLQNIQSIQADPNLEPEAKEAAIDNAIQMANQTLRWASSFYSTPLPGFTTPGQDQESVMPETQGRQDRGNTQAQYQSLIDRTYRAELGRAPDLEGMRYWMGQATRNGWDEATLAQAIRNAA